MKKLCFISLVASPHQVKFIPYLRKYFDAEFYFYEQLAGRQSWWKMDLGEHGHIIPCGFRWHGRYFTLKVLSILRKERPNILMLGTFSAPANFLAYAWGRLHGCKIVVLTERSRHLATGVPRPYDWKWKLIHWYYRKVDMVMTVSEDIVPQFRDDFHFGDKVVASQYPADIDRFYAHKKRSAKDAYTLIFPNRLTNIYNPLFMIDVFKQVGARYPKTILKMNASGELRAEVESYAQKLGVSKSVQFLDGIKSWDELDPIYQGCDIMVLPAKFSNGNYTIMECAISGMACILSDKILGESVQTYRQYVPDNVLSLDVSKFVQRICNYIEHPEKISEQTSALRQAYHSRGMAGTAELYRKLFDRLG